MWVLSLIGPKQRFLSDSGNGFDGNKPARQIKNAVCWFCGNEPTTKKKRPPRELLRSFVTAEDDEYALIRAIFCSTMYTICKSNLQRISLKRKLFIFPFYCVFEQWPFLWGVLLKWTVRPVRVRRNVSVALRLDTFI